MRFVRRLLPCVVAAALLAGCSRTPSVAIDASGLTVISDTRDHVVPEQVRDAYAAYDLLTESYPEDFAYASPNLDGLAVHVGVVTDRGRHLLASLALGRAPSEPSSAGGADDDTKREVTLTRAAELAIGLRAVAVETRHSRRESEGLKDEAIEWGSDARFADAGIWMSEVERSTGMVVLGVEQLTPGLAQALAARYGTDRLVVRVAERPEPEASALDDDRGRRTAGRRAGV